jgi:MarR family transcriptional regulator for hemolysin
MSSRLGYDLSMGPPEREPVGLALARTAKVVNRAFDDALAEAGGSLPTWLVLVSLRQGRHAAQRELAEAVGVEGPTLTHHLNRMERQGLVTRRVHRVELTEAGQEAFRRLLATVTAFDRRLRRGLSREQVEDLEELLGRLRENVA